MLIIENETNALKLDKIVTIMQDFVNQIKELIALITNLMDKLNNLAVDFVDKGWWAGFTTGFIITVSICSLLLMVIIASNKK